MAKEYYGKRPLWQWIILYLIIGGIVYAVVYYAFLAPKGLYKPSSGATPLYTAPSQTVPQTTTAPSAPSGGGYKMPGY